MTIRITRPLGIVFRALYGRQNGRSAKIQRALIMRILYPMTRTRSQPKIARANPDRDAVGDGCLNPNPPKGYCRAGQVRDERRGKEAVWC